MLLVYNIFLVSMNKLPVFPKNYSVAEEGHIRRVGPGFSYL